ncbi:MAG: tripartite tricarboxylate transporter TctB family protein [Rhodospirillales bacterium]
MLQKSITVRKPKDLILGIILLTISIFVIVVASGYDLGTTRQMGPGYLPIILGSCLGVIAAILIGGSFIGEVAHYAPFVIRPTIFILGAALTFALLIRPLGLLITVFLLVIPAVFADGGRRLKSILTLALVLAIGTTLLFPIALGQQIPIFGHVFSH